MNLQRRFPVLYGKTIVALCTPKIHEATNHRFITTFAKCLASCNARLLVYSTPSELFWNSIDEQGEKAVFDLINYDITDAVVINEEAIKDKDTVRRIILDARAHGLPVITIGAQYPGCTRITFDYTAGFEKIVRHVIADHNVKDIHMIAGIKGNEFSEERIDVVRKVAAEYDVDFGNEDISYGEFWSVPTENAVEQLFVRRRNLPQAIICANDTMAITTVSVLKRHGIKIPENVIVTGFDGINEIRYSTPQITTSLCSSEHLAQTVSDTIMQMLSGRAVPGSVLVVPELQASESCGCTTSVKLNASEELTYINNSFNRYQNEEEHMFRMISRILECQDFSEVANELDKYDFYDMVIALNPECTDRTYDPLRKHAGSVFADTVKIIYNMNFPMHGRIDDMRKSDLHPNMKDMLTEHEEPLIFLSLNYMGVPMGFLCFNYHNYDIQNYYKASQITSTLNTAFGAFRSMQYQHYLTEKIEEMYRCDGLTHLLNRAALKNLYPELLKKCSRTITVILADLDGLKHINDNYGHDDGDYAICAVADALRSCCPQNALCVRWGGDEMVAVIPGTISSEEIYRSVDAYLENLNSISGKEFEISASVGIKSFDLTDSSDLEYMIRMTDELMYSDKNQKKELRTRR